MRPFLSVIGEHTINEANTKFTVLQTTITGVLTVVETRKNYFILEILSLYKSFSSNHSVIHYIHCHL